MGEAKRRKLAGTYPEQTKDYRAEPRISGSFRRRFFGMMNVKGRLVLPGSSPAIYERVNGSLRRVRP